MSDKKQKSAFDILKERIEVKQEDEKIRQVEKDLSKEKKERLTERFYYFFGALILLNFCFLPKMSSWSGPLVMLLLDLMALTLVAKWMEIKGIEKFLNKVLFRFIGKKNGAG